LSSVRQSELGRRSEEKVAALNLEAERARLETAQLYSNLLPRTLSDAQLRIIVSMIDGELPAVNIASEPDLEPFGFAQSIAKALRSAAVSVEVFDIPQHARWFVNAVYDPKGRDLLFRALNAAGVPVHALFDGPDGLKDAGERLAGTA
jgi:hypothetical protein